MLCRRDLEAPFHRPLEGVAFQLLAHIGHLTPRFQHGRGFDLLYILHESDAGANQLVIRSRLVITRRSFVREITMVIEASIWTASLKVPAGTVTGVCATTRTSATTSACS